MIPPKKYPELVNPQRQKANWWLLGAWGRENGEWQLYDGIFFWSDNHFLELDKGGGCRTLWRHWMSLSCHVKRINFMLCEVPLNKKRRLFFNLKEMYVAQISGSFGHHEVEFKYWEVKRLLSISYTVCLGRDFSYTHRCCNFCLSKRGIFFVTPSLLFPLQLAVRTGSQAIPKPTPGKEQGCSNTLTTNGGESLQPEVPVWAH